MLDNNTYNLMMQMVEENQSLWRIKNMYTKDASNCSECSDFWNNLASQKEQNVDRLEKLIKSHLG